MSKPRATLTQDQGPPGREEAGSSRGMKVDSLLVEVSELIF